MGGHPALLLRRTQAHPDKIRLCRVDLLHDLCILVRRQRAERRRVHPRDDRAGVLFHNFFAQDVQRLLRRAVEIVAVVLCPALLQKLAHQVGAGHAGGVGKALPAAVPGQRPAVRQGQDRAVLHLQIGRVVVGRHGGVDVRHTDIFPAPTLAVVLHLAQRFVHIGDGDVHAHNVAGLHAASPHFPVWLLLYHTAGRLSTGQGETHIFCRFFLLYVHQITTFPRQIPVLSNFTRLRLFHLSVMTIFVILYLSRRYSLEFQITVCYNFYTIVKGRSLTFFRYGIWALSIYFSRKGGYYQ